MVIKPASVVQMQSLDKLCEFIVLLMTKLTQYFTKDERVGPKYLITSYSNAMKWCIPPVS